MPHPNDRPIPLTELPVGATARLHEVRLDDGAVGLLRALGLSERRNFRLCKAGEPCIVQVGSTRIGVSNSVATRILVVRDPAAA